MLDAQNQTNCPGPVLLEHVRRYRESGKPTVDLGAPVKPPAPAPVVERVRSYIDPQGHAIVEINFGGQATEVVGVNVADLGVSVRNAGGETYDRSIQSNTFQPWGRRAS